jgi:hypothetical protein
MMHIT